MLPRAPPSTTPGLQESFRIRKGGQPLANLNERALEMKMSNPRCEEVYPLNPKIKNLNSHLLPLFISYRGSGKKLIKYQANSSCVIKSIILMTTLFYKALIVQGEIWWWSLLGLLYVAACLLQSTIFLLSLGLYPIVLNRCISVTNSFLFLYAAFDSWSKIVVPIRAPCTDQMRISVKAFLLLIIT